MRAMAFEYKSKLAEAKTPRARQELQRNWRLKAMIKSHSGKDGSERSLSSYRRTLTIDQRKVVDDLRILGQRNKHASLLILFGTYPNATRQDILIGGSSEAVNAYFSAFPRQNATALACALQSFAL